MNPIAEALSRLPDYLGSHVRVSVTPSATAAEANAGAVRRANAEIVATTFPVQSCMRTFPLRVLAHAVRYTAATSRPSAPTRIQPAFPRPSERLAV